MDFFYFMYWGAIVITAVGFGIPGLSKLLHVLDDLDDGWRLGVPGESVYKDGEPISLWTNVWDALLDAFHLEISPKEKKPQ